MASPTKPPSIKVVSVYGTRDSRRSKESQPQIYSRPTITSTLPQSPSKVHLLSPQKMMPTVQGIKFASPAAVMPPYTRKLDDIVKMSKSFSVIRYPRNTDRSKGLRHFSTKVCEKVREKGVTNYNEVADELVQEYFESMPNPPSSHEQQMYDQKNIRRRVYDALNVLMAMNIVSKEKKEIRWVGLPTSSLQECKRLEEEKAKRIARIRDKREELYDLMVQLVTYGSLRDRNLKLLDEVGEEEDKVRIPLPFIVVTMDKAANGNIEMNNDKTYYRFAFDRPFHFDTEVDLLTQLGLAHGLGKGTLKNANMPLVKRYLPIAFAENVDELFDDETNAKYEEESAQHAVGTILSAIGVVASQQRNETSRIKEEPITVSHSYAKVGLRPGVAHSSDMMNSSSDCRSTSIDRVMNCRRGGGRYRN